MFVVLGKFQIQFLSISFYLQIPVSKQYIKNTEQIYAVFFFLYACREP